MLYALILEDIQCVISPVLTHGFFYRLSQQEAVDKLYSLQSNAAVIQQWQRERRDNLQLDLIAEMRSYMRIVGVDVRPPASSHALTLHIGD
jgi:hypothetical protein